MQQLLRDAAPQLSSSVSLSPGSTSTWYGAVQVCSGSSPLDSPSSQTGPEFFFHDDLKSHQVDTTNRRRSYLSSKNS